MWWAGLPSSAVEDYQHGGIVTRPTITRVGEKGPEAIIPLRQMRGGMGGFTSNVFFYGPIHIAKEANEDRLVRKIRMMQRDEWRAQWR